MASASSSRAIIRPYQRNICDEKGELEEWKKSLPAGMKFRPTKEDLIVHYLQVKIVGGGKIYPGLITDNIDIYKYHPTVLLALDQGCKHDDGKMYFFTLISKKPKKEDKKHMINRSVKVGGSWKASHKRANVESTEVPGTIIGTVTKLTFYTNAKEKTSWLMTELRLPEQQTTDQVSEMTLCVVYQHVRKNKTPQSSSNNLEG